MLIHFENKYDLKILKLLINMKIVTTQKIMIELFNIFFIFFFNFDFFNRWNFNLYNNKKTSIISIDNLSQNLVLLLSFIWIASVFDLPKENLFIFLYILHRFLRYFI